MKRQPPPLLGFALAIARGTVGWSGKELAAEAQVAQSTLSQYESGKMTLSWERYKELVSAMERDSDLAERALLAAKLMLPHQATQAASFLTDREALVVSRAAALAFTKAVEVLKKGLTQVAYEERVKSDREQAQALWVRLQSYSQEERKILIRGAADYHKWSLSVLLCFESERVAASDPSEAIALAELALLVAEHARPERWRLRLLGHAWLFLGNARRVANQRAGANDAFRRGWNCWETGEDPAGILDEGYLYDMEASLRRDERCLELALELHDKALSLVKKSKIGMVLLNKSITLQERGDYEDSIGALREARSFLDAKHHRRLWFALQFNLAAGLLHVGRAREAAPLVKEVREHVGTSRDSLDKIRVDWLEGNLAAELGDRSKAVTLLTQTMRELRKRQLPYDFALASLDLALVYRDMRAFTEIKALATEMFVLFQQQGIRREAMGAIILFQEIAQAEQVTAESLARIKADLQHARAENRWR